MRFVANALSLIFHPLFLVFGLAVTAYWVDKYSYYLNDPKDVGVMFIMDFVLLVLFPAIGVAMMAGLKMISGLSMKKREDRIGPLIITLSFYIWFFINVYNSSNYPDTLKFVALGITLSVGIAFFLNNFIKISLHAIGASSFCTALGILLLKKKSSFIDIDLFLIGGYRVSAIFVLLLCVVIAGAIGSARLYLKAHSLEEVYGGYLVGIFAQIIALRIIM